MTYKRRKSRTPLSSNFELLDMKVKGNSELRTSTSSIFFIQTFSTCFYPTIPSTSLYTPCRCSMRNLSLSSGVPNEWYLGRSR